MNKIIIGIDPGTHTGIAVKSMETGKLERVETMKIHRAMEAVQAYADRDFEVYVVVEDARKRKWYGKTGQEKLQGAGSIKRDCVIWEDFLTDLKVRFALVAPSAGKTKWTEMVWRQATGWKGRTSEHARDAAILIHSINLRNLKIYFR